MDQTENQNLQGSQFLKKVTHLLLSLSVFSFFFFFSSWYSSFSQYSFKFHFSAFPFHLILSHTVDKNCIFLLCNGILVILAKTSGFIFSSSASNLDDQLFKRLGDDLQLSPETKDSLSQKEVLVENSTRLSKNIIVLEEEEERENEFSIEEKTENTNLMAEDEEQETGSGLLIINTDGGEKEENGTFITEIDEESHERESEISGFLEEEEGNAEELNKKFDEFIRRMKKEMRIEAQQQLVMV